MIGVKLHRTTITGATLIEAADSVTIRQGRPERRGPLAWKAPHLVVAFQKTGRPGFGREEDWNSG